MNKTDPHTSLRHSRQREAILALLHSTESHPTADWIYQECKKRFPNLSLGTVYRNLALLVEQGLVLRIQAGSTFDRYEARVTPHYHLVCRGCGTIIDFEMPRDCHLESRAALETDFRIEGHQVEFYGLCRRCQERD